MILIMIEHGIVFVIVETITRRADIICELELVSLAAVLKTLTM
ncbi:hypothetical protein SDC9_67337 [bioreactor metagenome]|uniref:Uncharacterized protein n=1 Tax=bioreactor metagenome TaxID=1076179 RepID=A0A644XXS8_9ZZZZ